LIANPDVLLWSSEDVVAWLKIACCYLIKEMPEIITTFKNLNLNGLTLMQLTDS